MWDTAGLKVVVADKAYTGKANTYKSTVYVSINGTALKKSDYTVTYYSDAEWTKPIGKGNLIMLDKDQTESTVYVKIVGKGNYAGAQGSYATAEYKVVRNAAALDLSKAKITVVDVSGSKLSKVEYTGDVLEPSVKVEVKAGKSYVTVDPSLYKVSYANNVNKGKATVIINGNGTDTVGNKTTSFKIVPENMKNLKNLK